MQSLKNFIILFLSGTALGWIMVSIDGSGDGGIYKYFIEPTDGKISVRWELMTALFISNIILGKLLNWNFGWSVLISLTVIFSQLVLTKLLVTDFLNLDFFGTDSGHLTMDSKSYWLLYSWQQIVHFIFWITLAMLRTWNKLRATKIKAR